MSRTGTLHAGSPPSRLAKYFADNPDEELTPAQAAIKFGSSERAVMMAVARAVLKGELEYVRVIRLPAKGRS